MILMVVVIAGLYLVYANRTQPVSTPKKLYTYTVSQQNPDTLTGAMNVSQGETQQVNLALSSMDSAEIAVPIESLTLIAYNNTVALNNWNTSLVQQSVFNYSFSLNQLTLQPGSSNSTTLTIKWADNAPAGKYTLDIDLGNVKFLSTPGKYDISYSESISLGIIVTPKGT